MPYTPGITAKSSKDGLTPSSSIRVQPCRWICITTSIDIRAPVSTRNFIIRLRHLKTYGRHIWWSYAAAVWWMEKLRRNVIVNRQHTSDKAGNKLWMRHRLSKQKCRAISHYELCNKLITWYSNATIIGPHCG